MAFKLVNPKFRVECIPKIKINVIEKLGLRGLVKRFLIQHNEELNLDGLSDSNIKALVKKQMNNGTLIFKKSRVIFRTREYQNDYESTFYYDEIFINWCGTATLVETDGVEHRFYIIK